MSEKIVIAGEEVPQSDWEKTPASVKALIGVLSGKISEIGEKLGLNSQNSSQPPASDPPNQAKERQAQPKRERRRGGQKGNKGFGRQLYESSECREIEDHKPKHCQHCQSELSGEDREPQRHQIVEIPAVKLDIVEHRLHALTCERCGQRTRARLPASAQAGYGERLRAIVGLMSSSYRLSHQQVKKLLWEVWSVRISTGSINNIRRELSEKLQASVAAAEAGVRAATQTHADETSWQQHNGDGNNPEQKRYWLWVAVCGALTVYRITDNRRQDSAKALLGEDYGGIVVSDRYGGYNWLPLSQRQICWAHLKRDFTRIAERSGASAEIGAALLQRLRRLFGWWQRVRDGTLSRNLFQAAVARLRQGLRARLESAAALDSGAKTPLARTARTCAQILKLEPALWTFVTHEEVEPTNDAAERALRPAMIWRRLCFGSQSLAGSLFMARLLIVVTSLRAQGRSVLDFLILALRFEAPSLLPSE